MAVPTEDEVRDLFRDAESFQQFLDGEDYSYGLVDVPDAEYDAHYEAIVCAVKGVTGQGIVVAGHRTPSIAESRENFRITAVKVYEIKNGQLGRLYRDGGITSDSRDYFMSIDAVGNDLRVNPIPNCGKGQPMQAKRMSNGGPTMRGIARLTGPG